MISNHPRKFRLRSVSRYCRIFFNIVSDTQLAVILESYEQTQFRNIRYIANRYHQENTIKHKSGKIMS